MTYRLEFNNNEVEVDREFDSYDGAFNYGVGLSGQWVVVEVKKGE